MMDERVSVTTAYPESRSLALAALGAGLWGLEAPRAGLEIRQTQVGRGRPVTVMRAPEAEGPVVVHRPPALPGRGS